MAKYHYWISRHLFVRFVCAANLTYLDGTNSSADNRVRLIKENSVPILLSSDWEIFFFFLQNRRIQIDNFTPRYRYNDSTIDNFLSQEY